MIVLIDYDLFNYKEKFRNPNLSLLKYYAYYKQFSAVEVITSIAGLRSMTPPEKAYVFSDVFGIGKQLWNKTIRPILEEKETNVQVQGLGFYGYERTLPKEVEDIDPDYSAYYDWIREMVVKDKITIKFCHNFTKTDVINPKEENYLKLLQKDNKKMYCSIIYNNFIYTENGLKMLKLLEKKYTKVRFYQPFQIGRISVPLLKAIGGSTRIINNVILLDVPKSTVPNAKELISIAPLKNSLTIPCDGTLNKNIEHEITELFEWLELSQEHFKQVKLFLKQDLFNKLPIEVSKVYSSIKLWTNFRKNWVTRSAYETITHHSIDWPKMRESYGEDCEEDEPIYRKDSYLDYTMAFFREHKEFNTRFFFIKENQYSKKEDIMNIYEIKKEVKEINKLLEKEISSQVNQFIFNPNIQDYYSALADLQSECPHEDEAGTTFSKNGVCSFCGKQKL